MFRGKPGIAFSHYRRRGLPEFDWDRAARWVRNVLRDLLTRPWQLGTFWNVNLPHLEAEFPDPDVVFCPVDRSPLPIDFRIDGQQWSYSATYQHRGRVPGSDVNHCFEGRIAVSVIQMA
jgi:5'-nucleotidase